MSEPGPAARPDRVAELVEQWELREAVGGLRGVVDSGLASTVFLVVYLANRDHTPRLAPRGGVHASSR